MQTIYGIKPITGVAKDWIDKNVPSESWQWLGSWLNIGHGFIADVVAGMMEAGLLPNKDFAIR